MFIMKEGKNFKNLAFKLFAIFLARMFVTVSMEFLARMAVTVSMVFLARMVVTVSVVFLAFGVSAMLVLYSLLPHY